MVKDNLSHLRPIETEKRILGTILVSSGESLVLVDDIIREQFFSSTEHKQLYSWILNRVAKNNPADLVSLLETSGVQGCKKYGGIEYVSRLGDDTIISDQMLRQYAQRVSSCHRLRQLRLTAKQILASLEDVDEEPENILRSAEASILDVGGEIDSIRGILSLHEAVSERKAAWRSILAGDDVEYVPTGFESFDEHYVGWPRGYMTIIGGRPEIGKTMFLVSAVLRAAQTGIPQGILSIEMPRWKLVDRMASIVAGVTVSGIHEHDETKSNLLMDAADELMKEPIYVDDASATADSVESSVRRLVRKHGCKVIWIDYLQLIRPPSNLPKNRNRSWEVDEISESLRRLAKQENVAVIALLQLNRTTEESVIGGRRGVPQAHHFRDSDKPLHDAALAFGLYRQFQYKKPKKHNSDTYENIELADMFQPFELIALKSRDHAKVNINLWARLTLQRVYDDMDDGFTTPDWGGEVYYGAEKDR